MTPLPKPKGYVEELPQPALPSPAELERLGYSFEAVARGPESPVRLRHHGICCGIFVSPQSAGRTIRHVLEACRA